MEGRRYPWRGEVIEAGELLGFIDFLQELLQPPPEHVYIIFTEHPGEDFHLSDRVLADWQQDEDSLA